MNTPQRAYQFMRRHFGTVAAYIRQDDKMRGCIESASDIRLKEIIYHLSLHNEFCAGLRKGMSL